MEADAANAVHQFGADSGLTTLIAEWAWIAIVAFVLLLFKGAIENAVEGLQVFMGNDYNEDDIVVVDGRPGRIVRVGFSKTVFYLYSFRDGKITGGTKLAVENGALASMRIERPLPKLDPQDFYKTDEGPNGHNKKKDNPQKPPTQPKG